MVVLVAKGILSRDLALLCHYRGLLLAPRPTLTTSGKQSVNAMAAVFVAGLQEDLPSAVSTIRHTAGKLQVIEWHSACVQVVDVVLELLSHSNTISPSLRLLLFLVSTSPRRHSRSSRVYVGLYCFLLAKSWGINARSSRERSRYLVHWANGRGHQPTQFLITFLDGESLLIDTGLYVESSG